MRQWSSTVRPRVVRSFGSLRVLARQRSGGSAGTGGEAAAVAVRGAFIPPHLLYYTRFVKRSGTPGMPGVAALPLSAFALWRGLLLRTAPAARYFPSGGGGQVQGSRSGEQISAWRIACWEACRAGEADAGDAARLSQVCQATGIFGD